jgi:hypothetical protein
MNDDQTIVFINSGEDIMIIDLKNKTKVDLEDSLIISDVRCCINKYGHFLIKIDETKIDKIAKDDYNTSSLFITKWNNKLEIGDADLQVMELALKENYMG